MFLHTDYLSITELMNVSTPIILGSGLTPDVHKTDFI